MKFSKFQGTGNDFVVIDGRGIRRNWGQLAKKICDRHFGVGADGLLIVMPSRRADIRMRIFNFDGSEAETCGNGLRCCARYAIDRQMVSGPDMTIETLAGINHVHANLRRRTVESVTVGMGIPELDPVAIPVNLEPKDIRKPVLDYKVEACGRKIALSFVSMGNPHAVTFVDKPVADFPLATIGPCIETHPMFPNRTNFEIARVINEGTIEVRVWERGVGETLACGSGACAVAVAAYLQGFTGGIVDIILPGGKLNISWHGKGEVILTGPAVEVFTGEFKE